MAVIQNTWVEKQKKKKVEEKAPAFEASSIDSWLPIAPDKATKRFTIAMRASYKKTLTGVRK